MKALHIAELRASWRAWLSVCLPFITTSFGVGLSLLMIEAAGQARAAGRLDEQSAMAATVIAGMNVVLSALVGLGVMSSAAQLVVESRRGSVARLALAGASPGQIRSTLTSQLVAVSLAGSVVGALLALVLQGPVYRWFLASGDGMAADGLLPVVAFTPLVGATVGVVLVAVVAGIPVAVRATRIPPVEALRQAAAEPAHRIRKRDVILFVLFVVLLVVLAVGSFVAMSMTDTQLGDLVVATGLLLLVLTGLALQRGAPLLMRPLTRAWTALVPARSPSWRLARSTVLARSPRMVRTVVPVMMAVGIMIGMLVVGSGISVMIRLKYGEGDSDSNSDLAAMLLLVGLAFLISLSGAVGNLLMMSRQRDAELALAGISGATEDQQRWMVTFEGLIIGGTATLLGLVMAACTSLYINLAFIRFWGVSAWAVDPVQVAIVVVGALGLCVATTVLPSLPTLRQPPHRVVARLIAD